MNYSGLQVINGTTVISLDTIYHSALESCYTLLKNMAWLGILMCAVYPMMVIYMIRKYELSNHEQMAAWIFYGLILSETVLLIYLNKVAMIG